MSASMAPRMRSLRWIAVACLALFGTLLSTSGAASGQRAAAAGVIKIGLILPTSGAFASAGIPEKIGAEMKVSELNASGPTIVGGKRYKLQLDYQDDQSTPSTSVAAANQLIGQDGVKVLLGPIATMAIGVLPFAQQANVIQYTPATAAGPYLGTSQYPLLFGAVSTTIRVNSSVDAIKHWVPNVKKVAYLGPNDSTATALVQPLAAAWQAKGVNTQAFLFPSGTTDLSTVLTQVASYAPDVIFLGAGSVPTDTNTLKQLDAAGISKSTVVFGWGVPVGTGVVSGGRKFIASPLSWADFAVKTVAKPLRDFRKRFLAACGCKQVPPNAAASILFYDILGMMVDAMKAAGTTTDTNAIAQKLVTIKYKGTGVVLRYDPTSHTILTGLDVTLLDGPKTTTLVFY